MNDEVTVLNDILFEWDENKNRANFKKHGIWFNEAITVFADKNVLIMADEDHSEDEDRFIIIGLSRHPQLLVVCHCYRNNDNVIRIFSARKATKSEERVYGETL
jgi:uncharacterized DUF497 family protein